jgi:hypothetical protein
MSYPIDLDTLTDCSSDEYLGIAGGVGIARMLNNLNNAVEAIEAKVGKDGSAVTTSHDYKLSGVTGTDKAVSKTGTETLTNKILTTPTIGSLTNAQHTHANAAGGGQLDVDTCFSDFVHDHSAAGEGGQIPTAGIADDAITPPKAGDLSKCVNVQNITTNAVVTDQLIQRGWGFITFAGETSKNITITLPIAYDDAAYDISVTGISYKASSDPTSRQDITAVVNNMYAPSINIMSSSQFVVQLPFVAAATGRVMFSWIAIGTKAR